MWQILYRLRYIATGKAYTMLSGLVLANAISLVWHANGRFICPLYMGLLLHGGEGLLT